PTSTIVVALSTAPIWPSSHSAPLATHWLMPLSTASKPEDAMEPPMLPAWQMGLRASRPVQPAASMGAVVGAVVQRVSRAAGAEVAGSVQVGPGVEEEI